MDKLFNKFKKIKDKVKSKGQGSSDEDSYRRQLEEEVKKQKRPQSVSSSAASSESSETTTYENIPENEGGTYHVLEVMQVKLGKGLLDLKIEYMGDSAANSKTRAIDSMLIDEEMLYLEDEEADRMYQELKQRSVRRRNMEEKENRLNIAMSNDEVEEEVNEQQNKADKGGMNQSYEKIRKFIQKSN